MAERCEGRGNSLEEAANRAVEQLPARPGRDYFVGRVVEWGLQRGGFIDTALYYVVVEEDLEAEYRTLGAEERQG